MPILSPQIDLESVLAETLKIVLLQLNGLISEHKVHALEQAKILDVCKDTSCATLPNFLGNTVSVEISLKYNQNLIFLG